MYFADELTYIHQGGTNHNIHDIISAQFHEEEIDMARRMVAPKDPLFRDSLLGVPRGRSISHL